MSEEKSSSGYTYWKREIPDSHVLPSCEPKRIEQSSSEEDVNLRSLSTGSLASKWNAGTTYEEKDITARAKRVLADLISSATLKGHAVTLGSDESVFSKGEVHAHIVRGKAKIGYEIETLELCVATVGTLTIQDLDSTDPSGFEIKRVPRHLPEADIRHYVTSLMNDMCMKLLSSE